MTDFDDPITSERDEQTDTAESEASQNGDESVTGRGDGENAQCGFVDVCDTPYAETIAASRATADGMYQRRAAAKIDAQPKEGPDLK